MDDSRDAPIRALDGHGTGPAARGAAAGLTERRDGAPWRAAVVGAGYLGRFHARKYAADAGAELVAVVDTDPERARNVAAELGAQPYTSHLDLRGRVDVASVVVPTASHYPVARDLLESGIDVLVEKPMTSTLEQALALSALAERRARVLQVGHLERFNPVMQALAGRVAGPRYIEAQRLAPFQQRGTDVDVVLDLMIHDIDLILNLVGTPVREVRADGIAVLSGHVDIAKARLEFEGGCVASLTASRVSARRERQMRVFQADTYFAVDFDRRTLERRFRSDPGQDGGTLACEQIELKRSDPLRDEIAAFLDAVRHRARPVVTAADGCLALETALEISRQSRATTQPGHAPVGLWEQRRSAQA